MAGGMPANIGGLFYGLLGLLFVTSALAVVVYPILVAPIREIPNLCVRRWLMYWFGLIGFVAGGVYWLLVADGWIAHPIDKAIGNPLTGMMMAAMFGNVIGRVIWIVSQSKDEEARV
jgi:hypothetical protein